MTIDFLTPTAALIGVVVLVPLAAFLVVEMRAGRVRAALRLRSGSLAGRLSVAAAILLLAACVSVASAQPVVQRRSTTYARTDAAAFVVIDTSRSMLATEGPGKPVRFARAKAAALRLRAAIPDVPVGLASITDRVLPHVFATTDADAFRATLERSIGINRPPPSSASDIRTTDFGALSALANQNFFARPVRHRVVIVLTDGETIPVTATYLRDLYDIGPDIRTIFVRFWSSTERVYRKNGKPEPQYRPDPASGRVLQSIASTMGARLFSEHELGAAIRMERRDVGRGVRVKVEARKKPVALAPYSVLAALVPLGFIFWRRNV
jgi:von Willebrand factor type A domain